MDFRIEPTRRQFLTVAAASGAALWLSQSVSPASAATSLVAGKLVLDEFTDLRFFTSEYTVQVDWLVCNFLDIEAQAVGVVTLKLTVDNRVFGFNSAAIIQASDQLVSVAAESIQASGNVAEAVYRWDTSKFVAGQATRVLLPLTPLVAFPNDNVEAPTIPLATLSYEVAGTGKSQTLKRVLAESTELADVAPWAAATSAAWGQVGTNENATRIYRAPVTVRVESVGPNAIPAGLTLTIRSDQAFSESPALNTLASSAGPLDPAEVVVTEDTALGQRTTSFSLVTEVPAGEERVLILSWPEVAIGPEHPAVGYPAIVSVLSLDAVGQPQRGSAVLVVDSASSPAILKADVTKAGG